jgi:cellulose synthase/poly-beta-1,6-N-acetylglucosamine synthase-like glycosyltransferase
MLSTFICCRNHSQYLEESVESVLTQTHPPDQLLLINDASYDFTRKKMMELKEKHKDKSITVINHDYHQGHIKAYNEGIEKSKGEFIHLMAADDRLVYGKFYEKALEVLQDPTVGFVTGKLAHMNESGFVDLTNVCGPTFDGKVESGVWLREMRERGNIVCGGAVVLRKKMQEDVGGYDERLPFSADFLNWIKILGRCDSAFALPDIVYHYRRHFAQMTARASAPEKEREICKKELEETTNTYYNNRMAYNFG